jgi:hypothetical protein
MTAAVLTLNMHALPVYADLHAYYFIMAKFALLTHTVEYSSLNLLFLFINNLIILFGALLFYGF